MKPISAIKRIYKDYKRRHRYHKKDFGAIGQNCIIGDKCHIVPRNMYLGDNVIIQDRNNFISHNGKLIIKKYSVISSSCIIVPSTHLAAPGIPFYHQTKFHYGDEDHTITINEDCWVGAGCTLLSKCELGRGCVVAAGSVVTKRIPPYAIVAGVPAKIIGVKFSKEDIIRHERYIYSESERLTEDYIDSLFENYYKDLSPMKKCSDTELERYKREMPQ